MLSPFTLKPGLQEYLATDPIDVEEKVTRPLKGLPRGPQLRPMCIEECNEINEVI